MKTNLEASFDYYWRIVGGPPLENEVRFHPKRKWRFDFADTKKKIAIECEGGTYIRGRHSRGKGYAEDCEKYNSGILLGWVIFRLTSDMLHDDPVKHLIPIRDFILNK